MKQNSVFNLGTNLGINNVLYIFLVKAVKASANYKLYFSVNLNSPVIGIIV